MQGDSEKTHPYYVIPGRGSTDPNRYLVSMKFLFHYVTLSVKGIVAVLLGVTGWKP